MDKFKIKKPPYLFMLIVLGVNFLFILPFQVITFFSSHKKLRKELEKFRKEKSEIARISQYRKNLQLQKEKYLTILSSSVREAEISKIIRVISEKAKEYGVKLYDIKPMSVSEKTDFEDKEYYFKPISITAKTSFRAFMKFVKYLEDYKKFIRIKNLEIFSTYSGVYPVRFEIEVFVIEFKEK